MSSFVDLEIETDPDALVADIFDRFETAFPGWTADEGAPEVVLARILSAVIGAPLAEVASEMPAEAFRKFGEVIHGVTPLAAVSATAETTWTMIDNAGYTIPAGTQVAIATAGDTSIGFRVLNEVSVPNGSTATSAGEVVIQAIIAGTDANGLTGDPELVDSLAYVSSITQTTTATSGGVNAETGDEYLDRLRDTLGLLSQNAVVAEDVAVLARSVAGVERATVVDTYDPGTNEVQQVTVTGTPSSGTATLTYSGQTTAAIAYNADAATVQARLEALSNIAVGDVVCTGGPLPAAVNVEFTGNLAHTNVSQMTVTDSITGGDMTVSTTTAGVAHNTSAEKTVTVAVVDEDGAALSDAVMDDVEDLLELHREVNFVFYVRPPSFFNAIKVDVDVVARTGYDATGVDAAVVSAVEDYLDPANWGIPGPNEENLYPGGWKLQTVVRWLEIANVIENVDSVDHIVSGTLQIGFEGGSFGTSDLTLVGFAPLTTAGTVTVDVV